jgi:hypothetical protein
MTIKVYLNTAATPPVTVDPTCHHVNHGNETIVWVPGAQQNFTFSSLQIPVPPPVPPATSPFGTPTVSPSEITVTDNNGATGEYEYIISVSYNGTIYSSDANGVKAGGGNPSIKND